MLNKSHTLEVSAEDVAVIEAALHTRSQILNVQANAGGTAALEQLNQVKRTLATLDQQKQVDRAPCRRGNWLSGLLRSRYAG